MITDYALRNHKISRDFHKIETIDLFNWHCDSLHKMIENSIPENRRPVVWHIKISCELDGSAVKEEVKP